MITKDQIIGQVWKMFDLLPRPVQGAYNLSLDIYSKHVAVYYSKWLQRNSDNKSIMMLSDDERFELFKRDYL